MTFYRSLFPVRVSVGTVSAERKIFNALQAVVVGAGLAQTRLAGRDGFLDRTDLDGVAVVQMLAPVFVIHIDVINLAVLGPGDLAADVRLGNLLLLRGDGVVVDAGGAADEQGRAGRDHGDGLGLLVQILIGKQQDDQRNEGKDRNDQAHVVPQPEFGLVLLGSRIDVIRLLPELRPDDQADQIQDDQDDQEGHGVHEGDVDLAEQREDGDEFKGDRRYPQAYRADAQALGVADGLRFLGFFLAGHGPGRFFRRVLDLLGGFLCLIGGLRHGLCVRGRYDFFLFDLFSHVNTPVIKLGAGTDPRLR